ncbi:Alpha/Beta hydrolase protein [Cadophora sp. MPI-SDFR-AT-0126]|nr:Alpha/Beta hydrolase protein [Leotiomycetes sp. MPI-SDFR-AT-0126]
MMGGIYAGELARRGIIALAIDYRNYGESSGAFRQFEHPQAKAQDLSAAVAYLTSREDVSSAGLLGVCTSGGNVLTAGASDSNVKAIATVAGFFQFPDIGKDATTHLHGLGQKAQELYDKTGEIDTILLYGGEKGEGVNPGPQPYYGDTERGNVPEFRNEFALAAW